MLWKQPASDSWLILHSTIYSTALTVFNVLAYSTQYHIQYSTHCVQCPGLFYTVPYTVQHSLCSMSWLILHSTIYSTALTVFNVLAYSTQYHIQYSTHCVQCPGLFYTVPYTVQHSLCSMSWLILHSTIYSTALTVFNVLAYSTQYHIQYSTHCVQCHVYTF